MKIAQKHYMQLTAKYPQILDVCEIREVIKIVHTEMLKVENAGYDAPYDEDFPLVLYFVDNSVMIVGETSVSCF